MKIQIDTKAKTIKVDENVRIAEFIKIVKKMFPESWGEYSILGNEVIYWYNPIPWTYTNPAPLPWITYSGETSEFPQPISGASSIYNLEVSF